MTKHIPEYLRLHTEQQFAAPGIPSATEPTHGGDTLHALTRSFAAATGWPLQLTKQANGAPSVELGVCAGSTDVGDVRDVAGVTDVTADAAAGSSLRQAAADLAASINLLLERQHLVETELWKREAELAAGVPVSRRPDEGAHLAERLETLLRTAGESLDCCAAAAYLLDDATSHLKLRCAWGLPSERFLMPARMLRGSLADLEALVGHAVVLEDTSLLPHWKCPESFPAAACVPISTPSTPLGTLWFFRDEVGDFSPQQTNLMEIVAGRIAAELEREMLLEEGVKARELSQQMDIAAQRQHERLPTFAPVVDDWDISAWTSVGDRLSGDFYDWGVLPDGRIYLAAGHASGVPLAASLSAATLQAALRSHNQYPHQAHHLLERLNDVLWFGSTGDQFASLFYGMIDPSSGDLEFAFAGRIHGLIVSSRGCRPLTCPAMVLGVGPEGPFRTHQARLQPGESLALLTDGLLRGARSSQERSGDASSVLTTVAQSLRQSASSADAMVDQVRLLALAAPSRGELVEATIVVARRM